MEMNPGHGGICYVEIPAPDLAKARRFYATVFDWQVSASDLGKAAYAMFQAPGLAGGLDPRKQATDKGVLLYIKTGDIPAKLKEIERAGGRVITGRTQVIQGSDDYGFAAIFHDPNGNQLGLWAMA